MTTNRGSTKASSSDRGVHGAKPETVNWKDWLVVIPFFLFIFFFLVLPSLYLFVGSFRSPQGAFTFENILTLFQDPTIISAFWISIRISIVTALGGGILGFLMAYAVTVGGLPNWLRNGLATFSGVASNYGAVPLAFLFISTYGRTGLATVVLKTVFGIDLYDKGFSLYSFWGVSLTYIYFQLPLMILIIMPVLDGLKREWREACENLGGTSLQYWLHVALPILMPSLLGTMVLLFGNAFGAYATAYALTGGMINLVTILIGQQIFGDVLHNVGLGYSLAVGMVIVMAVTMAIYYFLRRRSERWLTS